MSEDNKVKGPASYFPSIEKKYGYPVSHWLDLLKGQKALKHMEMITWLKNEYKMGHGHANALLAQTVLVGVGAVVAALIAAAASFVSMISSKEEKVSEFRQVWINNIREEISEFLRIGNRGIGIQQVQLRFC